MAAKKARKRSDMVIGIESRLRSAADYLGAMIKHEKTASDSVAEVLRRDLDAAKEARRVFRRDFQSFIAASRTAWNSLNQLADAANCRSWLDERLSTDICRLHRELANQDTHAREVTFGVSQSVKVEGSLPTPLIHLPPGTVQRGAIQLRITEFVNMAFQYNPKSLEPKATELCERVIGHYTNHTVVQLCGLYLDELKQTLKSGLRHGRFDAALRGGEEPI